MDSQLNTLYRANIQSLELLTSGKVRDIYNIDENHMLIVTSDRLSAFDVVLPDPISGKGKVLTALSEFWFNKFHDLVSNHLTDITLESVLTDAAEREPIEGRGIVVKNLNLYL